ncbi:MAG TPA: CBS domain-containing protein [Candidatus Bathyarchaeia archaeon]|nr:CBS domain-containing protein [Candidatus Bathyarchaeia archaeon]
MVDNIVERDREQPISRYLLEELLPNSLTTSPVVSVRTFDKVSGVAALLPHHLETFTDSLVVTKDDQPVGIIGSLEILEGVLKNPNSAFFEQTTSEQIMNKDKLIILKPRTPLFELLQHWSHTRRAFAITPNQYHGYSVISARKLLEIGASCRTDMRISSIPKKDTILFRKEDTVRDIISLMFENKTRKLILKDTSLFISDRIIIQKITRELNCLKGKDNFLGMKADLFRLDEAKKIPSNLKINEASKIMYDMQSPYLMIEDHVVTPWDIAMALSSDEIYN